MRLLPLMIFILSLQIISPLTMQYTQALLHTQSPMTILHEQSFAAKLSESLPAPPVFSSKKPFGGQVNIHLGYSSEPAPMGIADYGRYPDGGAFTRESTQWLGAVIINSLSALSTNSICPYTVSFQLNTVLNYEYNGYTYALWVQDIARFNTQTDEIYFLNNIWNYSAPFANVTGVSGNGQICTSVRTYNGITYYQTFYFYNATNYLGSPAFVTLPTTVYFLVNVTNNSLGQPVICFWYNDGFGWVHFDTVTVTNVIDASNANFLVDGYTYTGSGNYYDSELVLAGPYGGLCSYLESGNVYFSLFYWNGHNFQEVRNAYNYGSDTAETVNNAIVQSYSVPSDGVYWAELTVGSGGLYNLWNQDDTTQLTVYASVSSGYIYVYNENIPYSEGTQEAFEVPFAGGEATLTLYPMDYAILVYNQNDNLVGEANIYAPPGQSVSTYTTTFSMSLNENNIDLYAGETNTVGITVNAYGNVTINVISPPGVDTSFTQETVYVYGEKTIDLVINPTQTGTFAITVNASIFPGYYITQGLILHVQEPLLTATFEYSTIGQQLPQQPEITLTFPNGTTLTLELYNGESVRVPEGTVYTLEQTISEGNIRWATPTMVTGVINNNQMTVTATYYEQYLVNFEYVIVNGQWTSTSPTVTYYYFTSEESASLPTQVWVNYNSPYYYSQNITVGNERIISTNYESTVTSPGTINVYYTVQYYVTVKSQIPVYAIINNQNTSLSSGWYNGNVVIQIENVTYYPSSGERYVVTSISPSETVTIDSPITIQINTQKQFYLTLVTKIPVYAMVNGVNESLKSGWYNPNTSISVENLTYYPTNDIRYVIVGIEPSERITVNSPMTVKINTIKQDYVTVNSVIPVKAIINGNMTYLNTSWMNKGTSIYVINYTYYVTNNERYVIINISPQSFTVTSPITVNISTVKQFFVTINNVSAWYNQGSMITLKANVPIYEVGEFVGTYNVSPNTVITVNSPIIESLVLRPNYVFYGEVGGVIVVVVAVIVVVLLLTRREK